jgi:hypothetical protein
VVTIHGDSYRLWEKRRSGLFRPQADGRLLLSWHRRLAATDASQGGLRGKQPTSSTGINDRRQPTQPITKTMSKRRHRRRSQCGTTPETTLQTGSGVAQFSVSEVAQFWMSVDISQ